MSLRTGARGRSSPTEPARSGPFPWPAVSHEPRIQQLHDDFLAAGRHPFHLPVGVDLNEEDPEAGRCVRCVRPALEYSNVELIRHAKVERLLASGGSVTGVETADKGTFSADIVVVSCGAANSAALLLKSASDEHPRGLANSSDVVGRHYMAHINSGVIAISQAPNPTKFQKTLGVNDYYWGDPDGEFGVPLGHIQMLGKSDRNILRAGAPWFAPGQVLDYMSRHAIDFWLTTEDLPHPDNRVTVDRQGRIHLAKVNYNAEPHRRLLGKLKGLLGQLGCHEGIPSRTVLDQRIPLTGVAHQCGTVRFGADPETSALDANCKAHDLDNLYVVDASFFPSSSAVNPALTAMANALRVGDHLIDRLGARARTEPEEAVL